MAEIIVVDVPIDEDLAGFSQYLWQQKVPHRIVENNDRQFLVVGCEDDAKQVSLAYQHFQSDSEKAIDIERRQNPSLETLLQQVWHVPVTLCLLLLGIAGFFVVYLDSDYGLVKQLTFTEFTQVNGRTLFRLPSGEYWRLITPIFLHFGVLHIVFNTLWLWDLGRRIELMQGSVRMISLVVLMGVGSNMAQYLVTEIAVFGGMSGVIYGLLGYGWIWSYLRPSESLQIPKAVINFMLAWLVICLVGLTTLVGAGNVANAAHVGGLIMGMVLGFGAGKIAKTGSVE
jgi:GlpG protein